MCPAPVETDAVRSALGNVVDPCSIATGVPITLEEMGLVQEIEVDGGDVRVVLRLTSPVCWQATNIVAAVEAAVGELPKVDSVTCAVDHGAQWMPEMMDAGARARLRKLRPVPERPGDRNE